MHIWMLMNISTEASKGGLPEHCFHHYCLCVRAKGLPMHLYTTRTIKPQKKGAYCHNRVHVYQKIVWHLAFCVHTDACVLYCELLFVEICKGRRLWLISYHRNVNRSGLPKGHVGWCSTSTMHHCALCHDHFHSEYEEGDWIHWLSQWRMLETNTVDSMCCVLFLWIYCCSNNIPPNACLQLECLPY